MKTRKEVFILGASEYFILSQFAKLKDGEIILGVQNKGEQNFILRYNVNEFVFVIQWDYQCFWYLNYLYYIYTYILILILYILLYFY